MEGFLHLRTWISNYFQDAQVLISFELIPGLPPKPIPVALQTTRAPPALVQKLLPNYYAPTQSTIPEPRTKYHPAPPVIIKSVRDESFYQPDTAIVGKRNLLLTMIFCSLGIISLCGAVYLVRKYTLEVKYIIYKTVLHQLSPKKRITRK